MGGQIDIPVIIHIGYHKTATTWFQKQYFQIHPDILFLNQRECQRLFVEPRSLDFCPDETYDLVMRSLRQENPSEKKIMVLSNEEFSGNIHSGGNAGYVVKEIAERLLNTFSRYSDIKLVIFIRNQFSIIDSCYRQYIQAGGICSLSKYLFPPEEHHRRPMFSFEHLRYDKLVKYYMDLFGEQNIKVFLFEDFRDHKDKFLMDFESILGIPRASVHFDLDSYANMSMSDIFLLANRFVNGFSTISSLNYEIPFNIPKLSWLMRKFTRFMQIYGFVGKKSSLLPQDTRKYIGDYYKEGNKEIARITAYSEEKLQKAGYPI